jgi:dethiobiotin synthetase
MIFVTGTDTGCGKTTVGRALAAASRARGLRVGVVKPVETGCEAALEGQLLPADALALARAAGLDLPLDRICPYRLALPASPERASEAAGLTLDLAVVAAAVAWMRERSDVLLVEGAGGLLVPYGPGVTTPTLALALSLPILVVARDALGTVNHTLLTVEAISARGAPFAGVVLSATAETRAELENARAIEAHGGGPVLGTLPWLPGASDEDLGRAAAERLDLDRLLPGPEDGRPPGAARASSPAPRLCYDGAVARPRGGDRHEGHRADHPAVGALRVCPARLGRVRRAGRSA